MGLYPHFGEKVLNPYKFLNDESNQSILLC